MAAAAAAAVVVVEQEEDGGGRARGYGEEDDGVEVDVIDLAALSLSPVQPGSGPEAEAEAEARDGAKAATSMSREEFAALMVQEIQARDWKMPPRRKAVQVYQALCHDMPHLTDASEEMHTLTRALLLGLLGAPPADTAGEMDTAPLDAEEVQAFVQGFRVTPAFLDGVLYVVQRMDGETASLEPKSKQAPSTSPSTATAKEAEPSASTCTGTEQNTNTSGGGVQALCAVLFVKLVRKCLEQPEVPQHTGDDVLRQLVGRADYRLFSAMDTDQWAKLDLTADLRTIVTSVLDDFLDTRPDGEMPDTEANGLLALKSAMCVQYLNMLRDRACQGGDAAALEVTLQLLQALATHHGSAASKAMTTPVVSLSEAVLLRSLAALAQSESVMQQRDGAEKVRAFMRTILPWLVARVQICGAIFEEFLATSVVVLDAFAGASAGNLHQVSRVENELISSGLLAALVGAVLQSITEHAAQSNRPDTTTAAATGERQGGEENGEDDVDADVDVDGESSPLHQQLSPQAQELLRLLVQLCGASSTIGAYVARLPPFNAWITSPAARATEVVQWSFAWSVSLLAAWQRDPSARTPALALVAEQLAEVARDTARASLRLRTRHANRRLAQSLKALLSMFPCGIALSSLSPELEHAQTTLLAQVDAHVRDELAHNRERELAGAAAAAAAGVGEDAEQIVDELRHAHAAGDLEEKGADNGGENAGAGEAAAAAEGMVEHKASLTRQARQEHVSGETDNFTLHSIRRSVKMLATAIPPATASADVADACTATAPVSAEVMAMRMLDGSGSNSSSGGGTGGGAAVPLGTPSSKID